MGVLSPQVVGHKPNFQKNKNQLYLFIYIITDFGHLDTVAMLSNLPPFHKKIFDGYRWTNFLGRRVEYLPLRLEKMHWSLMPIEACMSKEAKMHLQKVFFRTLIDSWSNPKDLIGTS